MGSPYYPANKWSRRIQTFEQGFTIQTLYKALRKSSKPLRKAVAS